MLLLIFLVYGHGLFLIIGLLDANFFSCNFQVRHPNILSFLHSTEAENFDGSSAKVTIYIVTEPVMPLAEKLKELGLKGTQRYELTVVH